MYPERTSLTVRTSPWIMDVDGGVYPLAFRKDCGRTSLLVLFNLTLDAWPHAQFTLADGRKVEGLKLLRQDGLWAKDKALRVSWQGRSVSISHDAPVTFDKPLFSEVAWEKQEPQPLLNCTRGW